VHDLRAPVSIITVYAKILDQIKQVNIKKGVSSDFMCSWLRFKEKFVVKFFLKLPQHLPHERGPAKVLLHN